MDSRLKFIQDLSIKYKRYVDEPQELFDDLNSLTHEKLDEIFKEYGDPENRFQPVNLLRAEICRRLMQNEKVSLELIDQIKQSIRDKDINAFTSFPKDLLKEFSNYTMGSKDIFTTWKKPWAILHTFFYRGEIKDICQINLKEISKNLLIDLGLKDYTYHFVDFYGTANFGNFYSWLSLYPLNKNSHQDAYQFHLVIREYLETGIYTGQLIKNNTVNKMEKTNNYSDIMRVLNKNKSEILKLNKELNNYYKFAPGANASEWDRFYEKEIAAVNYQSFNISNLTKETTLEEVKIMAGLPRDSSSNQVWNLWLFVNSNIGDVVFASQGVNKVLGIGIIEGEYYYTEDEKKYNHQRKVKWITNRIYDYKSDSIPKYKNLFRPDTFSPTLQWQFIINEYLRLYPDLEETFTNYGLKHTEEIQQEQDQNDEFEPPDEIENDISFWWLNANPNIWSITTLAEGESQTYTARNEKGNKRRIYKYFKAVQPNDLIIGYESTPVKQIKAIFEVTKKFYINEKKEEIIEFQLLEKLEIPIHWNEIKNEPGLQDCEVLKNNQGSLFKLTEEEYDIIRELIDNKNIVSEISIESKRIEKYSFDLDEDKPFIKKSTILQAINILKRKKNIILQGPPGVGKTFIARKIAYEMMELKNDNQIGMVQFHQSYSYEDFIQGLRPSRNGIQVKNGTFYTFCKLAETHPDRMFFFIIDEINRGNLSKIFGELMMLIEHDKRDKKFAIKLTYSEEDEDKFFVPSNLFIIGTMNTADRSLAIVDYALRRRFAFINLIPEFGNSFKTFIKNKGITDIMVEHICSSIRKVNQCITEDVNLGNGFQIGHSYFCSFNDTQDEKQWWKDILQFEIIPLLEEIWFDDQAKVDSMKTLLEV